MKGANGKPQGERDWLWAIPRSQGQAIFLVFVAPTVHYEQMKPTFEKMLGSVYRRFPWEDALGRDPGKHYATLHGHTGTVGMRTRDRQRVSVGTTAACSKKGRRGRVGKSLILRRPDCPTTLFNNDGF